MPASPRTVHIDEELCDGCGLCLPACHEGAIQIVDGKARLLEELCDGLGACLGECPKGAIRFVEQESESTATPAVQPEAAAPGPAPASACGCSGGQVRQLRPLPAFAAAPAPTTAGAGESSLSHWPVQINLVPTHAPFLRGADLLVAADCVPVAHPNFHRDFLAGRAVMIGCPKFDDLEAYIGRFEQIFRTGQVRSVTIAAMEVPCCQALPAAVLEALRRSGKNIPVQTSVVGLGGEVLATRKMSA